MRRFPGADTTTPGGGEDAASHYTDGDRALLIDCGGGAVRSAVSELGVGQIDRVLFTHHHRDHVCGIPFLHRGPDGFAGATGIARFVAACAAVGCRA
ncbi:MAG: MBL fold metallo-hydrolase [Lentisphaeria bacterium]|nr:MBL fold metallo-hydrolase [Lentisphaeria bacterium]